MRKSSSKRVVLKHRGVVFYYFYLYDDRVHRKIFKDCINLNFFYCYG